MTKNELIKELAVSEKLHLSTATQAVNGLLRIIKEQLNKGGEVAISGFGSLSVVDVPARQGFNPQTKEAITIAAHRAVRMRVSKELKELVNA